MLTDTRSAPAPLWTGALLVWTALIPWLLFVPVTRSIELPLAYLGALALAAFGLVKQRAHVVALLRRCPEWVLWVVACAAILAVALVKPRAELRAALNVVARFGAVVAAALSVSTWVNAGGNPRYVARTLVLSAMPIALLALGFVLFPHAELPFVRSMAGVLLEPDAAALRNNFIPLDRVGVVFTNTNHGAAFWGLVFWLAGLLAVGTGIRDRAWHLAQGLATAAVLATGSRAGLLGLGVSVLVFAYAWRRAHPLPPTRTVLLRTGITMGIVTLAGLGLALGLGMLAGESVVQATLERSLSQASGGVSKLGGERMQLWKTSLALIRERPLFGHGTVPWAELGLVRGAPPHNIVLQWAVVAGVPAALLSVLAYFGFFARALRARTAAGAAAAAGLAWVGLQANVTNWLFGEWHVALTMGALLGAFVYERWHAPQSPTPGAPPSPSGGSV